MIDNSKKRAHTEAFNPFVRPTRSAKFIGFRQPCRMAP